MEVINQTPEVQTFLDEMQVQVHNPPRGETVLSTLNAASLEAYATLPTCQDSIVEYIDNEKVENPSYRVTKWLDGLKNLLISDDARREWGYPQKFTDPAVSLDYLTEIFSHPGHPEQIKLRDNLAKRSHQKNRAGRAKALAFVAAALYQQHRIEGPVIYEIGPGANLALIAMATKTQLGETAVLDADGSPNEQQAKMFNWATSIAPLGEGIGIEDQPPKTLEDKEWLKSCSLDPSEVDWYQPEGISELMFDLMTEESSHKVKTVQGHFPDLSPQAAASVDKKADIIWFSHTLSQNMHQFERIIKAAVGLLKPRGVVLVNDYANVNPRNPQELTILDHWYPRDWLVQTLALQASELERGWFPLLTWENSHCERVRLSKEIGRIASAFV